MSSRSRRAVRTCSRSRPRAGQRRWQRRSSTSSPFPTPRRCCSRRWALCRCNYSPTTLRSSAAATSTSREISPRASRWNKRSKKEARLFRPVEKVCPLAKYFSSYSRKLVVLVYAAKRREDGIQTTRGAKNFRRTEHYKNEHSVSCKGGKKLGARFMCIGENSMKKNIVLLSQF